MSNQITLKRARKRWMTQYGLMALAAIGTATTVNAQGAAGPMGPIGAPGPMEAPRPEVPRPIDPVTSGEPGETMVSGSTGRAPAGAAPKAAKDEKGAIGANTNRNASDGQFVFGRDYMRVSIEYIFLPRVSKQVNGVTVRVSTKNKQPLSFDFAVPSEAGQTYSNMGQWLVVPYVALNNKGPLEITQEIRTQRDRSSSFSWIPNMLTSVAGLLTGGWATTASSLAQYTTSASNIVKVYDNHTQVQDVNHFMLFDNAQGHGVNHDISEKTRLLWFSLFSRGTGFLNAWEGEDKKKDVRIKEPEDIKVEREWANDHPTFYKFRKLAGGPWYYPMGKEAYIILKFEKYTPYPSLNSNPRSVPGVGVHFDNLEKILVSNPPTTANTDKTAAKLRQSSLDTEGSDLMKTLGSLTASGDLSLTDAHVVMAAFIKRVKRDASGVKLNYLKRINHFPASLP